MIPSVVRSCFVSAAAAWVSSQHTAAALHMHRLAESMPAGDVDQAALAGLKPDNSAEVRPRHQGLGIRFVRHAGSDLKSVVASLSAAGKRARYSVEEMQEMQPTAWKERWATQQCVTQREAQKSSEYFMECSAHRPITWTKTHKLGYMKTAKAASTAFTSFFHELFPDATDTFDANDVPDDTFIFTFVREPFQHKLAAFAEVDLKTAAGYEKTGLDKNTYFQHVRRDNASAYARLWIFLDDVRNQHFQVGDARRPEHAGNQIAAALCERTPDYIGRLEHLTADWDRIQELANLSMSLRTKALPIVHADTRTVHSLYKDDESIAMDTKLMKKICRQYRSEFACLDYDTPKICQSVLKSIKPWRAA